MDEDFLDVQEGSNKGIIFIFILLIVGISVFGYFFVYQKFHFALATKTYEIGSTLSYDVNDYLEKKVVDTSGYKLDLSKVNIEEVGEYAYSVTYNKSTRRGKVKVVDTTPPEFETRDIIKEKDDNDFYLGDFLTYCEDASKPCLVTLKNDKDDSKLSTIGTHKLTIVVSDVYKNKKEAEVNLEVVEHLVREEEKDLEYASSSSTLPNFNGEYYIKLDKAIDKNSEEAKEMASEIDTETIDKFVSTKYSGYKLVNAEIVEVYNKSGYVIGYVVKITINNGEDKVVYLTK